MASPRLIGNLLIATGSATEHRINEAKKQQNRKVRTGPHPGQLRGGARAGDDHRHHTGGDSSTKRRYFEFIDVPGHLELIKNMMSGASNSDISILMVSAKREEGFNPQTKRHIYLSNMFGTKALVVAINKMDHQKYSKEVFDKTKEEVSEYLKSIGFNKPTAYIPISAYNNENLITPSKNMKWYKGKPLIETVREFAEKHSKSRSTKNGLRIFVQDSVEIDGKRAVFGVIYNGTVRKKNEQVRIEPENKFRKDREPLRQGQEGNFSAGGHQCRDKFRQGS